MQLRWYQTKCIQVIYDILKDGCMSQVAEIATSGGKSFIIAQLVQDMLKWGKRVLMVTHSKELIDQNYEDIKMFCPDADIGIFSASIGRREHQNQVVCAGVQSLANHIYKAGAFDCILVDEAHLIPSNETTQYQKVIQACKVMNPNVRIIGLTATPYRMDNGLIYGKEDSIFEKLSYKVSIKTLLEEGYVTPIIGKGGLSKIDTSQLGTKFGDFIQSELAKACSDEELVDNVVKELVEYGADRKAWLVFCTGVENAEIMRDKLRDENIGIVEMVTGSTPKKERENIINEYKKGNIRCIVNVGTLTTGFNAPLVDLLALVRATGSASLFAQIIGRLYRLHKPLDDIESDGDKILYAKYDFEVDKIKKQLDEKGISYKDVVYCENGTVMANKENGLFLDYGSNILRLGMVDDIQPPEKKLKKGKDNQAPTKECPKCHYFLHISAKECLDCGHEFVSENLATHEDRAYSGAVMSSDLKPIESPVYMVMMSRHRKSGGNNSVKCTFMLDNFSSITTYICIEHDGYAREKAKKTLELLGLSDCETVADVLMISHKCIKPKMIRYMPGVGKKYSELKKIIME